MNKKVTALIHHPYTPPAGFASPAVPVHKGSTVFFNMELQITMRFEIWLTSFKNSYTLGQTKIAFVPMKLGS